MTLGRPWLLRAGAWSPIAPLHRGRRHKTVTKHLTLRCPTFWPSFGKRDGPGRSRKKNSVGPRPASRVLVSSVLFCRVGIDVSVLSGAARSMHRSVCDHVGSPGAAGSPVLQRWAWLVVGLPPLERRGDLWQSFVHRRLPVCHCSDVPRFIGDCRMTFPDADGAPRRHRATPTSCCRAVLASR